MSSSKLLVFLFRVSFFSHFPHPPLFLLTLLSLSLILLTVLSLPFLECGSLVDCICHSDQILLFNSPVSLSVLPSPSQISLSPSLFLSSRVLYPLSSRIQNSQNLKERAKVFRGGGMSTSFAHTAKAPPASLSLLFPLTFSINFSPPLLSSPVLFSLVFSACIQTQPGLSHTHQLFS